MTQQIILEPLTDEELRRRGELERVIERGVEAVQEMWAALAEIRDRRLFRSTHATFDAYCHDLHGFGDSRARQLIGAHEFIETTGVTGGNERQVRALKSALNEYPAAYHTTIVDAAKNLAAQQGRAVTPGDLRVAGNVITQVAQTGAVDLGDGSSTPINAALTAEQFENLQRQRDHISESTGRKQRPFWRFIAPLSALGGGTMTFNIGSLAFDELRLGTQYEVTVRQLKEGDQSGS